MGQEKSNLPNMIHQNKGLIWTPLLIIAFVLLFSAPIYRLVGEQNYAVAHLIIAILIIIVSATVTIQTWMFFHYTLSLHRLVLGSIFLSVTILEIFHAVTYKGMPFFFTESSPYYATWFYLINRVMLAIAVLYVVATKDRKAPLNHKWLYYGIGLLYSIGWIAVVYLQWLPELVIDGAGTTPLKNGLQTLIIAVQIVAILLIIKKYQLKDPFYNMVLLASVYFIISDFFYIAYNSVYDILNFIGHIFQVFASYSILKGLYYSSIEEPFLKQKQAEEELKKSQTFLQSVTTNMGEGLLVYDDTGKLVFMNEEAERILKWKKEELLGKNIYRYLFNQEMDYECLKSALFLTGSDRRKVEEDTFYRKDGSEIPVSYILTPYKENDRFTGTVIVFRDITEQKKDKDLIKYLAYHDDLTQLPNSRKFNEQLQAAIEQYSNEKIAVIVVDIDRFKHINDSLGHQFGDSLLVEFAKRLRDVIDPEILIARYKGDEFTLLLAPLQDEEEIGRICQCIEDNFNEPLHVQDLHFIVSLNFGVAIYPEHGRNSEELVKNASIAMLQALEQNETYLMYQASMSEELREQLELESDLHQALMNDELFLVYQPQVDIQTMEVNSLEALLRWNHPTRGYISPGKFIPIAEQSGLIIPIGEWALRQACRQLKVWHSEGHSKLRISVNLSARQLYQENLVKLVLKTLHEFDLDPSYLELEITESMTMINIKHSLAVLKELRQIGVRIAIDDFGTGYSSLSYLKHLPFDRLKIDQSFIKDFVLNEDSKAIVEMIVAMARHLNMEVVAEGVETLSQLKNLQEINCRKIQGFLFKEPIKPEQFSKELPLLEERIKKILIDELQAI